MSLDLGSLNLSLYYLLILLVPGLVLLSLRRPSNLRAMLEPGSYRWPYADPAGPMVALGIAAGLGLALQPLYYLWARALQIPDLGALPMFAFFLLFALLLPLRREQAKAARASMAATASNPAERGSVPVGQGVAPTDRESPSVGPASDLAMRTALPERALQVLLLIVLASRWWAAKDLAVPMFGDSLHHTMIVRLFDLQGGLPESWQPFAPLSSFSYHFGLHAGVASLTAAWGAPAARALIVAGQLLMVLQVLTAYALVAGLTGRRWAGLGAALAAGGLSTMPAYYLNWGRYTQLAGQVLLPIAALLTMRAAGRAGRGERPWREATLAAIAVAGLALTHYLVTLMFALLVGAWWILGGVGTERASRASWSEDEAGSGLRWRGRSLAWLIGIAAGAFALCIPWIPRFLAGPLGATAAKLSTGKVADPDVYGVVSPWQIWNVEAVGRNLGWPLVLGAIALLAIGLARRDRLSMLATLWIGLLVLATYPALLGLSITGVLKDFTLAIGSYLPASLALGGGLGVLMGYLNARGAFRAEWAVAMLVIAIAAAAGWRDRDLVEPGNVLVLPADLTAMEWIRDNTPEDARFLAGSFSAFGDTVQAGDDAGWWLPLLAEPRRGSVPPITYGIERSEDPGYRVSVNDFAKRWQTDLDGEATRAVLVEAGITHAYVGAKAGSLDGEALASSPYWREIFSADGARVFAFDAEGEAASESEEGEG